MHLIKPGIIWGQAIPSDKVHRERSSDETSDIKVIHRAVSKDHEILAPIDFDDESLGTRRMYQLAGPLFHTLIYGGVLIIDELEDSPHIHMLKTLPREFFEHSNQSQIIFTTMKIGE